MSNASQANVRRRCTACGAERPSEHTYCHACGKFLGQAVMPSNTRRFKPSGLGMGYSRIMTRQDRRGEPPLRTKGDHVARWFFNLTIVVLVILWASSRGYLPHTWWERARTVLHTATAPAGPERAGQ